MVKLLIQIIGVTIIVFCLIKTNFFGLYNPYHHFSGTGLITHEDVEMTPPRKTRKKKEAGRRKSKAY